jgi:hypothetical protein
MKAASASSTRITDHTEDDRRLGIDPARLERTVRGAERGTRRHELRLVMGAARPAGSVPFI